MDDTKAAMTRALRQALDIEPSMELFEAAGAEKRAKSLPELYDRIHNCTKCSLGFTRTKFVFGVGNPHAEILFIGEAPGRDEDLKGEPFVGRAGQLLDKMLAAIELDRKQVYIANILKCRPPDNRPPLPEESETCVPHLAEQIRLIAPKFIVCLGRSAAQFLLETTTPISKLRGKWFEYGNSKMLVTFHPAALLRNPEWKRDSWEDLKDLRRAFDRHHNRESKF